MPVEVIYRDKIRWRAILSGVAITMAVIAAILYFTELEPGAHLAGIIIVLVIALAATGAALVLNAAITRAERGEDELNQLLDALESYLRSISGETESRLYLGLLLTIRDHYLAPEVIRRITELAIEGEPDPESVTADEFNAAVRESGRNIVHYIMSHFEHPASGQSGYFQMPASEQKLYTELSRRVLGVNSIDNRLSYTDI